MTKMMCKRCRVFRYCFQPFVLTRTRSPSQSVAIARSSCLAVQLGIPASGRTDAVGTTVDTISFLKGDRCC